MKSSDEPGILLRLALVAALGLACLAPARAAGVPVSELKAAYRDGQIFLTWREEATPEGTTFNVYRHHQPITKANLAKATKVGHHLERHSARDWWQDPASFAPDAPAAPPAGFRIQAGAAPLDPSGGLFVHTVTPQTAGASYFAVTSSSATGVEDTTLVPGVNTLIEPVVGRVALAQPIWQEDGPAPAPGSGKGKSLTFVLHGRGGGKTAGPGAQRVNYLAFGDAKQGWREGLPFKFLVSISDTTVRITPCDRHWAGRPVTESPDRRDHCPAISSFWYGYNSRLYETTRTTKSVVPNYTEEQILWMMRWAQAYLGTDPNRTYLTGGSMGGSGAISLAMHYPQHFAAVMATVPVVSFTTRGGGRGSLARLDCACGPVDATTVNHEGVPLLEHMNGELQAARAKTDLPYLFVTHGRTDRSIPWANNPPFYRAMNAARQGLSVYWNNEDHAGVARACPDDVKAWTPLLERFALNRSFPVFTNCSDNKDPGDGDPARGDIIGWMNRGLDWKDVVDTPTLYAITVIAAHPEIRYPVTVDLTLRRLQQFKVRAGEVVKLSVGGQPPIPLRVDEKGLITISNVRIESAEGTRIQLAR
jgi:dienelactone hydrolase